MWVYALVRYACLSLLILAIISITMFNAQLLASQHSYEVQLVRQIAEKVLDYVSLFAPPNLSVVQELEEIARYGGSLNELFDLLTKDSDNDSVPDVFEIVLGTNPFVKRSFGVSDAARLLGRLYVDGYPGDWYLNSRCITKYTSFEINGERIAEPKALYVARYGKHLFLALTFKNKFVYANTSLMKISVTLVGSKIIKPSMVSRWGIAVEVAYPITEIVEQGVAKLKFVLKISTPNGNEIISTTIDFTNVKHISTKCWPNFVEPMWTRWRSIERLPFYVVLAYGDNRPSDWVNKIEFSDVTYKMFEEFALINPVAIIGTGDHVGAGKREQIKEFLRVTASTPNHWVVAGNHDWSYVKYADRNLWERYVAPNLYVKLIDRWMIVLVNGYALDDVLYNELHRILEEARSKSLYVVLAWHVPITYQNYNYPTDFSYEQMEKLRTLVKEYRDVVKLMLFGHIHVYRYGVYEGVPYIITGGGGAPLSSSAYGIPVYHYIQLVLYPNGSLRFTPIATENGDLYVYRIVKDRSLEYIVWNTKRDIYGDPVNIFVRLEDIVKGLHVEILLRASFGCTYVEISPTNNSIVIRSNSTNWFVYVWGLGVIEPHNNVVEIHLPSWKPIESVNVAKDIVEMHGGVYGYLEIEFGGYELVSEFEQCNETTKINVSKILEYVPKERVSGVKLVVFDGESFTFRKLMLDLNPPYVKIMYVPDYVSSNIQAVIVVSDESDFNASIYLDDELVARISGAAGSLINKSIEIDAHKLGEGLHRISVEAIDKYGKISRVERRFVIDTTKPKLVVENRIVLQSITQRFTISANDNYEVYLEVICLNTSSRSSAKGFHTVQLVLAPIDLGILSPGHYLLKVVAKDEAGNLVEKRIELLIGAVSTTTSTTSLTKSTTTSIASKLISTYTSRQSLSMESSRVARGVSGEEIVLSAAIVGAAIIIAAAIIKKRR